MNYYETLRIHDQCRAEAEHSYLTVSVARQAQKVFEDRDAAAQRMIRPNRSLDGKAPILLCETEMGAKQVRRVLYALEAGGVA